MCETTSSALPRAVISRGALLEAASSAAAAGGHTVDLRRDAWGHGLMDVARAASGAGIPRMLVDGLAEVAALADAGIDATSEGTADIDPALLYGLPGVTMPPRTRPVLSLVGRVMSTKDLRAGDAVSYGYTHRADADTTVALVTGGYAQGIVRALGNRARVDVGGISRPIIGRVAMDVCVIDLQGATASVGDPVVYFGGDGPVASALSDWSAITGMSIAELVTVAAQHAIREVVA